MKITNAIKKLEKAGFKVELIDGDEKRGCYCAKHPELSKYIEFHRNGTSENITCIDLRTPGRHDDSMSDYHAGMFCDSITEAIRYAISMSKPQPHEIVEAKPALPIEEKLIPVVAAPVKRCIPAYSCLSEIAAHNKAAQLAQHTRKQVFIVKTQQRPHTNYMVLSYDQFFFEMEQEFFKTVSGEDIFVIKPYLPRRKA